MKLLSFVLARSVSRHGSAVSVHEVLGDIAVDHDARSIEIGSLLEVEFDAETPGTPVDFALSLHVTTWAGHEIPEAPVRPGGTWIVPARRDALVPPRLALAWDLRMPIEEFGRYELRLYGNGELVGSRVTAVVPKE